MQALSKKRAETLRKTCDLTYGALQRGEGKQILYHCSVSDPHFVLLGPSVKVRLIISAVKSDNVLDTLCFVEETIAYQQI